MFSLDGFSVTPTNRKSDSRGGLAELLRDIPAGAQLYIFTINPMQSRGGHWHSRKYEWFVCVEGNAVLVVEPDEGKGLRTEIPMAGDFSSVICVDPGTRHTFISSDGATIVACISESFNPADPDTFFLS